MVNPPTPSVIVGNIHKYFIGQLSNRVNVINLTLASSPSPVLWRAETIVMHYTLIVLVLQCLQQWQTANALPTGRDGKHYNHEQSETLSGKSIHSLASEWLVTPLFIYRVELHKLAEVLTNTPSKAGVSEQLLWLLTPLEFVFQEQSYSSLHSRQSLAWDHFCSDIDDPNGVIADFCRIADPFAGRQCGNGDRCMTR